MILEFIFCLVNKLKKEKFLHRHYEGEIAMTLTTHDYTNAFSYDTFLHATYEYFVGLLKRKLKQRNKISMLFLVTKFQDM